MAFRRFHHPDISLPVLSRTVGQEILELLNEGIDILSTRGRSVMFRNCVPNERAYYAAVQRLRRKGLVASIIPGKHGILRLTDEGQDRVPDYFRPARFWDRKWDRRWYVLLYDVPERHRGYRQNLRRFLKKSRMGRLQKSAWITPEDIRPLYVDLQLAAGIRDYAILLESHTVMGEGTDRIVYDAWPIERLHAIQNFYLSVYTHNLEALQSASPLGIPALLQLARDELVAFSASMTDDPLLPHALLPHDYLGKKVHALHNKWTDTLARRLYSHPGQ